ncbi:MAG: hypothetical protein JNL82_33540 [Myxococcales bacterium]|nr:hypothetical protein [Myxococcales bacterium]
MPEQQKGRFVGHSKQFSLSEALDDAVQQALKAEGVADGMVEFEVVNVRGRSGGFAGFRDVWVEISVGAKGGKDEEPKYTTLAVGEEGGDEAAPGEGEAAAGGEEDRTYTTLAVGEEGGDEAAAGGEEDKKYTTLAVGEEGGEEAPSDAAPRDPDGITLHAAAVAAADAAPPEGR